MRALSPEATFSNDGFLSEYVGQRRERVRRSVLAKPAERPPIRTQHNAHAAGGRTIHSTRAIITSRGGDGTRPVPGRLLEFKKRKKGGPPPASSAMLGQSAASRASKPATVHPRANILFDKFGSYWTRP